MCFVFIWEQTATCATYILNWLVFITEMKSVYREVRTGSLTKAVCASYLIEHRNFFAINKHIFDGYTELNWMYIGLIDPLKTQNLKTQPHLQEFLHHNSVYPYTRHWIPKYRSWITTHSSDPHVKKTTKQKPKRAVRTSANLPNLHFHFFLCVFLL